MPLLDHFHEPLFSEESWESFHSAWAGDIMGWLNRMLPRRYRAYIQTHLGRQIEADVTEYDRPAEPSEGQVNGPGTVAVQTYAPPVVALTLPVVYPDDLEVQVMEQRGTRRLVAVVELVSPGNKDRPEKRAAFAAKCAAYLQRGIGVVTVDTVTTEHFHLHNDLAQVLRLPTQYLLPQEQFLSAVSYRPARREERNELDVWPFPLTVGGPLPVVPLALKGTRAVPLDLETTYMEARQRSGL
jgi:hypothetical protein